MDFTSKGKSWAGSIYHQFESICHDVDGFMSKDTVQYVENQVQSVGQSVKRLYTSVKDMIPPLEEDHDRVKSKVQQVHSDEDEIKDQIDAKNPTNLDEDALENSLASLTFEENKSQPTEPDSCPDAKSHAVREEHHNHTARNDLVDVTTNSNPNAEKDRTSFITFSYHTDCFSDASTSGWSFEDNLSSFEDPKTNEDKIPSSPTVSFADKACQCNDSVIDSHASSDFDAINQSLKEETISHNILTTSYSNISKSLSESTQSSGALNCDELACNSFYPITDADGEMETIDLSTDAKPDRSTVVSDNSLGPRSLSYRRKNFRYYKGLMTNAISSRKRLSKEYEHLHIMYGDIDTELLHDFEPRSLPSSSSSLSLEMVDNEWELL